MPSLKDVQGLPEDLPRELGQRLTLHEDERRAWERNEKLDGKRQAERDFELPVWGSVWHPAELQHVLDVAARLYLKTFVSLS